MTITRRTLLQLAGPAACAAVSNPFDMVIADEQVPTLAALESLKSEAFAERS